MRALNTESSGSMLPTVVVDECGDHRTSTKDKTESARVNYHPKVAEFVQREFYEAHRTVTPTAGLPLA